MTRSFDLHDIANLAFAIRWTLLLTGIAFVGTVIVASVIVAANISRRPVIAAPVMLLARCVQGVPLLVILFILYFGVASLGWNINAWVAAAAGLSVYGGVFVGEIWSGAIRSVPRTQWEAATSIGLTTFEQFRHVILPQSVRIATPPTVGFLVQLIKSTSLASTVGIVELTRSAQFVSGATFRPFAVFLTVAVCYFAICFPLTMYSRYLETRLRPAS